MKLFKTPKTNKSTARHSIECFNNEKRNLKKRIEDIESTIKTEQENAITREETLHHLLEAERIKCTKLQLEFKIVEETCFVINSELNHVEASHQHAKNYIQQVEASTRDFSMTTATDRLWLDAELLRRKKITEMIQKRSKSDTTRRLRDLTTDC